MLLLMAISEDILTDRWIIFLGALCAGGIAGNAIYKAMLKSMPEPPEWTITSAFQRSTGVISESRQAVERERIPA